MNLIATSDACVEAMDTMRFDDEAQQAEREEAEIRELLGLDQPLTEADRKLIRDFTAPPSTRPTLPAPPDEDDKIPF